MLSIIYTLLKNKSYIGNNVYALKSNLTMGVACWTQSIVE